ncbi:hypothetical protein [Maridesulfovibrio sp.]
MICPCSNMGQHINVVGNGNSRCGEVGVDDLGSFLRLNPWSALISDG